MASLVGCWLFTLFASALWSTRTTTSTAPLDAWAETVFGRAIRATWAIWALLTSWHVQFWLDEYRLAPAILVPTALLLATRWIRSEAGVWSVASIALLLAGVLLPEQFSMYAVMTAATLALRGLRNPSRATPHAQKAPAPATPYRTSVADGPAPPVVPEPCFVVESRAALIRLLTGSLFALYLAAWTSGWTGGTWPEHVVLLDAVLLSLLALVFYKTRSAAPLVSLVVTCLELAVDRRWISAPESPLEWGVASASLGFVLLLGSLAASWRLRDARAGRDARGEPR
jgi:hypothetical protein